jgi:hypothetical protein
MLPNLNSRRRFFFDFLAVIPWDTVLIKNNPTAQQLSRLFKLLRLPKLFLILNQRNFNSILKAYYTNRLKRVIKDPQKMQLTKEDNNKIMA